MRQGTVAAGQRGVEQAREEVGGRPDGRAAKAIQEDDDGVANRHGSEAKCEGSEEFVEVAEGGAQGANGFHGSLRELAAKDPAEGGLVEFGDGSEEGTVGGALRMDLEGVVV
jgi:hypothetical protein